MKTISRIPGLEPIAKREYYETSNKQRHEWVFAHSRQNEEFLFKIITTRYVTDLNVAVLEKAVEQLIKRHESLRTNFVRINGALMQQIHEWEQNKYCIHLFDLRGENSSAAFKDTMQREACRMVNYETEPLMTVQVFRMAEERYAVVFFVEHIISDTRSTQVMMEELGRIYENVVEQKEEQVAPDQIQLKDYVAWKNEAVNGASNKDYWETISNDESYVFDFKNFYKTYGHNQLCVQKDMKGKYTLYIGEELKGQLTVIANLYNVGLSGLIISAFVIFLSNVFNQKNILVSVFYAGREMNATARLLANCTDFVFLFTNVDTSVCVDEMVKSIFMNFLGSVNHQYPWSDDGQWPFPDKDLFKINYVTEDSKKMTDLKPVHEQQKSPGMTSTSYMQFLQCANGIELLCKYSLRYYSKDMIEFLCDQYVNFLKNITKNPHALVSDLKLG